MSSPNARRDRIVGIVLLVFAVAWSVAARETIPAGFGGQVGPRAFPLLLGYVLAGLSALLVLRTLGRTDGDGGASLGEEGAPPSARVSKVEVLSVASIFVAVVAYGFFLPRLGFTLATPIVIVALLRFGLAVRNRVLIAAFAVGMTAGCWLVFNKLMGAYLPPGTWIQLF